ncbi:uncharacterized protein LOC135211060 [Macrobrachium nipponense]|uniref:uncharacterized protein LOC135211060 n=1 Tax=Macrobrachium nipponense TaxID=159736 RepID=UPI0030C7ABC8
MAAKYPFSKETYNGFLLRMILDEVGSKLLREIHELACKQEGITNPLNPENDINNWISHLKDLSTDDYSSCEGLGIDNRLRRLSSEIEILKKDNSLYKTKIEGIKNLIQELKKFVSKRFCDVGEEFKSLGQSMDKWFENPFSFNENKFKESFDICEKKRCKIFAGWGTNGTLEWCLQKLKDIRNDEVCHKELWVPESESERIINDIAHYIHESWMLATTRFSLGEDLVQNRLKILNGDIERLRTEPLNVTEEEFYKFVLNFGKRESFEVLETLSYVVLSPSKRVKVSEIFNCPEILSLPDGDIISFESLFAEMETTLIQGVSGMGKLTLLKFIVYEWLSSKTDAQSYGGGYDIIIPINFRGCSERLSDSLSGVIRSYLPKTFKKFQGEKEMMDWILKVKALIVFNRLDLRNPSCKKLFDDIQDLNKVGNFNIICTANPGKMTEDLQSMFTKHLEIRGLPEKNMEDLFKKYQSAVYDVVDEHSLSFFRMMFPFVKDQFRLPLNMAYFSLNLATYSTSVNCHTTIYDTLHSFYEIKRERLIMKLVQDLLLSQVSKTSLQEKVSKIMLSLKEEAFERLKMQSLRLSDAAMQRLGGLCERLELPVEEILCAFLAPETCTEDEESTIKWHFPNKEQQRFLAALHVHDLISGKHKLESVTLIHTDMIKYFIKYQVPCHRFSSILNSTLETLTKMYSHSLSEALHNLRISSRHEYQYLLVILIGIYHRAGDAVSESTVSETVNLLLESGNLNKDIWARIFNNIYFDENSLKMIYQNPRVVKGITECHMTKTSYKEILLYGKWFRGSCLPETEVTDPQKNLSETSGLKELLIVLIRRQYNIDQILDYLYYHPGFPLGNAYLQELIMKRLADRSLRNYKGPIFPEAKIPGNVKNLSVSIGCSKSLTPLKCFLESPHDVKYIEICMNVETIDPSCLKCLACPSASLFLLYLPDVKNSTVTKALDITCKLQPLDICMRINFPRCKLGDKDFGKLLEGLGKQKSKRPREVYFPSCYKKTERKPRRKSLENQYNVLFHFTDFQYWGSDEVV